ncbi:vacuolar protein sorting-associated protein 51 [Pelomyxa schiedti]|nr:vacuolar protein sorting-associated protein 51 [Pelomyxa schiedti]
MLGSRSATSASSTSTTTSATGSTSSTRGATTTTSRPPLKRSVSSSALVTAPLQLLGIGGSKDTTAASPPPSSSSPTSGAFSFTSSSASSSGGGLRSSMPASSSSALGGAAGLRSSAPRSSFDHVGGSSASPLGSDMGTSRRAPSRMLLSTYYSVDDNDTTTAKTKAAAAGRRVAGLPAETKTGGATGSGPTVAQKPEEVADININSPTFNAQAYFNTLIKSMNLVALSARDKELVAEMKDLDEKMKALVYDNYNKFINATDTIRKMKSNVENMEDEMKQLKENMKDIGNCSDKINSSLSFRREKIDHLAAVHTLLTRLQFIAELPARLRKCLTMKAYSQAAKYFMQSSGMLKKYNLPSFIRIQAECEEIIKELRTILYAQIKVSPPPPLPVGTPMPSFEFPARAVEQAGSVLMMLHEPEETVRHLFLDSYQVAFDYLTEQYSADRNKNCAMHEIAKMLCPPFFSQLLLTYESYRMVFLGGDSLVGDEDLEAPHYEGPAWDDIFNFLKDKFEQYLRSVHRRVAEARATGQAVQADEVASCLAVVHEVSLQVHHQLPFLHIAERTADMIGSTVLASIESHFLGLHSACSEQLLTLHNNVESHKVVKPGDDFWSTTLDSIAKSVLEQLVDVVKKLQPFLEPEKRFLIPHQLQISTNIYVKAQQFFLFLEQLFMDCENLEDNPTHPLRSMKISPPLFFVLVGVLHRIDALLDEFVVQLQCTFIIQDKLASDLINADEIRQRFRTTASKLLQLYVIVEGRQLSSYMHKYIESANWLRSKEVRGVGLGAQLFMHHIQEIDMLGRQIIPDTPPASAGVSGRGTASRGSAQSKSFFGHKMDMFARVDYNRDAVMVSISRIGMKTMCECIRLSSFGRCGYQQVQVDVAYLQAGLSQLLNTKSDVNIFFAEAEVSAQRRCIDPVKFDTVLIQHILHPQLAAPSSSL